MKFLVGLCEQHPIMLRDDSVLSLRSSVGPIVPLTVRYSPSSEVETGSFTWAATNEPNLSSIFLLSENVENY